MKLFKKKYGNSKNSRTGPSELSRLAGGPIPSLTADSVGF